jgi:hypothetical protein
VSHAAGNVAGGKNRIKNRDVTHRCAARMSGALHRTSKGGRNCNYE